jgi:pyruvate kinase
MNALPPVAPNNAKLPINTLFPCVLIPPPGDSPLIKVPLSQPNIRTNRFITKSICYHAAIMADAINAKAITTLTNSGYTAFQISAWRPKSHILVFTSNRRILTQLNLLWGVRAFFYDKLVSTDDTIDDINKICVRKYCAWIRLYLRSGTRGGTNLIRNSQL